MAIPWSVRPVFLKRYFRLGRQWPYHSLTDRVCGMVTDVLGQKSDKKTPVCETVVWPLTSWSKRTLKIKFKKPGLWDRDVSTGRPGQKPDRKKMTRSVRQRYGLWRVNNESCNFNVFLSLNNIWVKYHHKMVKYCCAFNWKNEKLPGSTKKFHR